MSSPARTRPEMARSAWGRPVAWTYDHASRISRRLLVEVVRREGGQMFSETLREVLLEKFHVAAGAYSYGSLLDPGQADPQTTIGRYVSCGPAVRRFGAAHPTEHTTLHPFAYADRWRSLNSTDPILRTPLYVGDDSWIGANAVILPAVRRIGFGAVIGAGAVVTGDVADFAVVLGNPAREVRLRLNKGAREQLLEDRPWELSPSAYAEYHRNWSPQ